MAFDTPGLRKNKFGMKNDASCLKEDEEEDVDEYEEKDLVLTSKKEELLKDHR